MLQFHFLGIPVRILPHFWLFLLFFTDVLSNPSIYSLIVGTIMFFSILIHEYGHAITAYLFGAKPEITLEAFGGYASYEKVGLSVKKEFLITLNGPLLQSSLIAISYFLLKTEIFNGHPYIQYTLFVTKRLNTIWCLFNLIPLLPLDGGHLFRYICGRYFGLKGLKASTILGLICVVVFSPYLFFLGYYWFGALLIIFGIQNYQLLQNPDYSPRKSFNSNFSNRALSVPIREETIRLKQELKSKDPNIKTKATEALAKRYNNEGEFKKAYKLLLNSNHTLLQETKSLLCKLAFKEDNFELIKKYSYEIYKENPCFDTAILNSKAHAALNEPFLCGGWLKTASLFGPHYLDEISKLITESVFEKVRENETFKNIIKPILESSK